MSRRVMLPGTDQEIGSGIAEQWPTQKQRYCMEHERINAVPRASTRTELRI